MGFKESGYATKPAEKPAFFIKTVHLADPNNLMAINMAFYYNNNNRIYDGKNGDGTGGAARKDPNKFDCSEFAAHATRNFVKAMQVSGRDWDTDFQSDPKSIVAEKLNASAIGSMGRAGKLKEGMLLYHFNPGGGGHVAMVTRNLETGNLAIIESHGGRGLKGGVSTRELDRYLASPGQKNGRFIVIDPFHSDRDVLNQMEKRFEAMHTAASKVLNSPHRKVSSNAEAQAFSAMKEAAQEVDVKQQRNNNVLPARPGVTPLKQDGGSENSPVLPVNLNLDIDKKQKLQIKPSGVGLVADATDKVAPPDAFNFNIG